MKYVYEISTEAREIEFDLVVGESGELIVPLKLVCDDLDIAYAWWRKALATEPHRIGGKGQAAPHATLGTLQKLFEQLTTPTSFSKLKPKSKECVVKYYHSFASVVMAHHNPPKEESVIEVYQEARGETHLRANMALLRCTPGEITEALRTNQWRTVLTIKGKKAFMSSDPTVGPDTYHKTVRNLVEDHGLGLSVPHNYDNYQKDSLLKIAAIPLSKFEKLHPDAPESQRKLDYSVTHDVINGKLVPIGPQLEVMPWDNEISIGVAPR